MKLTEEDVYFSQQYDPTKYERPSVTADAVLFRLKEGEKRKHYSENILEVLLVKRGQPPYKSGWALPGGFCHMDETLSQSARRELYEETGLKGIAFGQVATYDDPQRDPRTRIITTSHLMVSPYGWLQKPKAGDDAAQAEWFQVGLEVNQLTTNHYQAFLKLKGAPCSMTCVIHCHLNDNGDWVRTMTQDDPQLAFDHGEVISAAVSLLRDKIYRTNLASYWLPQEFTLAELQSVFEAVHGQALLRSTLLNHLKHDLVRAAHQSADAFSEVNAQRFTFKENELSDLNCFDIWT